MKSANESTIHQTQSDVNSASSKLFFIDMLSNTNYTEDEYIVHYPYTIPTKRGLTRLGRQRSKSSFNSRQYVAKCDFEDCREYYTQHDLLSVIAFRRTYNTVPWPVLKLDHGFELQLTTLYSVEYPLDRWFNDSMATERERRVLYNTVQEMEKDWNATRTSRNSRLKTVDNSVVREVEFPPVGFIPVGDSSIDLTSEELDSFNIFEGIIPESIGDGVKKTTRAMEILGELSGILDEVEATTGLKRDSGALFEVERCVFNVILLSQCSTTEQLILQMASGAHEYSGISVLGSIKKAFDATFCGIQPESVGGGFVETLRSAVANWKTVKRNQVFEHINFIISCAISLQMCSAAKLSWDFNGFELYRAKALPRTMNAPNLITSILDSILFFVEVGHKCFTTGSITPLFYSEDEITSFETDYFFLLQHIEDIQTGNYTNRTGQPENHYARILQKCEERIDMLHGNATDPMIKTQLGVYRRTIKGLSTTYNTFRNGAGLRVVPETALFFGDTGVGKSTLYRAFIEIFCGANNIEFSDELIGYLQEGANFMDGWKTCFIAAVGDDYCNTKAEWLDESPLRSIIDIANPVPMAAPQAEAHLKGKVRVEPKVFVLTSNKEDLDAGKYSNKKNSVLRRIRWHITVTVKPEFRINGGHMLDQEKANAWNVKRTPEQRKIPDFWVLHVHVGKFSTAPDGSDIFEKEYAEPWMKRGITFPEFVKWYVPKAREYYQGQLKLVEFATAKIGPMQWCQKCDVPGAICSCAKTTAPTTPGENTGWFGGWFSKPQDGIVPESIGDTVRRVDNVLANPTDTAINFVMDSCKSYAAQAFLPLQKRGAPVTLCTYYTLLWWFWHSPFVKFTTYMPNDWLHDSEGNPRWWVWNWIFDIINPKLYTSRWSNVLVTLITCLAVLMFFMGLVSGFEMNYTFSTQCYSVGFLLWVFNIYLIGRCRKVLMIRIAHERNALPETVKHLRDNHLSFALKILGWSLLAYGALRIARRISKCVDFANLGKEPEEITPKKEVDPNGPVPESALAPECEEEVKVRESKPNLWAKEWVKKSPGGDINTSTPEQLVGVVAKSIVRIKAEAPSKIEENDICDTHGLFLKSNYLLTVDHHWKDSNGDYRDNMYYETISGPIEDKARARKHLVSLVYSHKVEGHDLRISYVPDSGSKRDLTKWFPITEVLSSLVTMVSRTKEGELLELAGTVEGKPQSYDYATPQYGSFFGQIVHGSDRTNLLTEDGMCGAPWISHTTCPCILGIHTAGQNHSEGRRAYYSFVTRKEIDDTLKKFEKNLGVLKQFNPSPERAKMYNRDLMISEDVHPKSFVNYIDTPAYEVLGTCNGGITPTSSIKEHSWANDVTDLFGVANHWGPPRLFPKWKPWYDTMVKIAEPSLGFPGEVLMEAIQDYTDQLGPLYDTEIAHNRCKPLTKNQCVNGVAGWKGVEALNFKSSPGYPLSGAKMNYVEISEEPIEGMKEPKILDQCFWDEVENLRAHYRRGEQYHPIFKACLKDEPKDVDSEKVRVFYAAQLAFVLEIRRLFLPVWHIMMLFPLVSEQAVGINCSSDEWEELMQYIEKFGKDRILAGDYKGFDTRMAAILVKASLWCYIQFAERTGNYSEDDILIMHGLATDMANPKIAVNGTMLETNASGPSGVSGTVQINGTTNSLYLRLSYFAASNPKPFKAHVAPSIYGDDDLAGVKDDVNWNFEVHKTYMKMHGVDFTTPDKDAEAIVDFFHVDDVDFLKRKSVFIPELNCRVGALDEDSIMKPLLCGTAPKVGDEKKTLSAIVNTTLFEAFLHGREKYDWYRERCSKLVDRQGAAAEGLLQSFDDRVESWKETYSDVTPVGA